jgi:crotonobetainyl-CoA:carnitine CoA-transferase CaiB-like acyl-CoA transferase
VPGILEGIDVLDLSWGIAGPIVTMLLADNGADVIKIEPPGGDPFRSLSGNRVWNRGKRSAVIDLKDPGQREDFLRLAKRADILVESFAPGTTKRLGIDYETLNEANPRLVYCSITGYGATGSDADRPGYDALVAARTGLQWESRGVLGGTTARLSGTKPILPDFEVPVDRWAGPPRSGPMFTGVPWPSMGAAYLAHLGISAALRAREVTGRGQLVETSLLTGALASGIGGWARAEHADSPGYESWIHDPRSAKGFFKCSDGRWVHQWVPVPGFLAAASGDALAVTDEVKAHLHEGRVGTAAEELVHLQAVMDDFTRTFARFSSTEWERAAAEAGVSVQTIRSPEEALCDPLLLADGCVTEVDDPDVGRIRHIGRLYRFGHCSWGLSGPSPHAGQHTEEVLAEAREEAPALDAARADVHGASLRHPLEGVRVVDFSIAVAGPFGAQLLAELGADVIKVNALAGIVLNAQMHGICERSKRSIAVNLKDPEGIKIFQRLVESADVVATNMREAAVIRLGLDYDSVRKMNPRIIYCHTRGYEDGPRKNLSGHDQSSAGLTGVTWIEGGMDKGGRPHWPSISLGDTGNGFLWAAAVVQALYHRDRTGQGQKVDTAIINAHLLNASMAWVSADKGGASAERPGLDAMALGWNALYRLYEGADGWICIAAASPGDWERLCTAIGSPELYSDPKFATEDDRRTHDSELAQVLEKAFKDRPVKELRNLFDESGVACEISSPDFILDFFNDPTNVDKQRLTTFNDPVGGKTTSIGRLIDFSDTPGKIWGPPLVVGDHTREILNEVGLSEDAIAALYERKIVRDSESTSTP